MKKEVIFICLLGFFPLLSFGGQTFLFVGEGEKCISLKESLQKVQSITVIHQKDIEGIIEEKKLQMLKEGKYQPLLPADFVVVCDEFDGNLLYRLIDTIKGTILTAGSGADVEELKKEVENFVSRLFVEERKPPEGEYLEVEVIGEGKKKAEKGKEMESERVLLMLAKRDAVERAYGISFIFQSKKDLKRVIGESRAFVSYRVLEEIRNPPKR